MSLHRLAVEIGVPPAGSTRSFTASAGSPPTPRCASRGFLRYDRFWLNLRTRYDLEVEKDSLGAALDAIRPLQSA